VDDKRNKKQDTDEMERNGKTRKGKSSD